MIASTSPVLTIYGLETLSIFRGLIVRGYSSTWPLQPDCLTVIMPYDLFCAIIGHGDEVLKVNIDKAETVTDLKICIKQAAAQMLASIDAHTLKLYKTSIDISETYMEVMQIISQSATWAEALPAIPTNSPNVAKKVERMNGARQLSVIFTSDEPIPGEEKLRIVVELPPGESKRFKGVWCRC